jgi:hypothetical protein
MKGNSHANTSSRKLLAAIAESRIPRSLARETYLFQLELTKIWVLPEIGCGRNKRCVTCIFAGHLTRNL